MTPEQMKANLAEHIKILEANIVRADDFAHTLGRRYGVYGVYGMDEPKNIYETRTLLRQLQEECETNVNKAEFLANVFTLDERGDLNIW